MLITTSRSTGSRRTHRQQDWLTNTFHSRHCTCYLQKRATKTENNSKVHDCAFILKKKKKKKKKKKNSEKKESYIERYSY